LYEEQLLGVLLLALALVDVGVDLLHGLQQVMQLLRLRRVLWGAVQYVLHTHTHTHTRQREVRKLQSLQSGRFLMWAPNLDQELVTRQTLNRLTIEKKGVNIYVALGTVRVRVR
jgi:hypothetical protein